MSAGGGAATAEDWPLTPQVTAASWTSPVVLAALGAVVGASLWREGSGPGAVVALAATGLVLPRHRLLAAGALSALAIALARSAGLSVEETLVGPAIAAAWLVAGAPDRTSHAPATRRSRATMGVLIAMASAATIGAPVLGIVLAVLAIAVRLATRTRIFGGLLDLLERPLASMARWLTAILSIPALVLVTFRWVTDRLVGYDPTGPARGRGRWQPSPPVDHPTQLVPVSRRVPTGRRWHRRAATITFLVLPLLALYLVSTAADPVPQRPATADAPHWSALYRESADITRRLRLDPVTFFRLPDYRSSWVNETSGSRRTWRPPPCRCQRLTVWWYGGSAAWGMYQRDDFTLPSQVARLAWSRGVALDIDNRAVPGFVINQEVRAFQEDLSARAAPDVVIFYDGSNDADMQVARNAQGHGDDISSGPDIDLALQPVTEVWDRLIDLRHRDRPGAVVSPADDGRVLDAEGLAAAVARRYRFNQEVADALARSVGVSTFFLWQPTVATTPAGTGRPEDRGGDDWRLILRRTPTLLGANIVDLSRALAGTDEPVFIDQVHTNESGARLVARAVVEQLLPAATSRAPSN